MMDGREPAVRVMMMPKDTNAVGTIFGGVILSHIDLAGAVEAMRHTRRNVVTVAMDEVVFKEPVFVGDLVSFYTETVSKGRSSVTVRVRVVSHRWRSEDRRDISVTEAVVTYVAVDDRRQAVALDS